MRMAPQACSLLWSNSRTLRNWRDRMCERYVSTARYQWEECMLVRECSAMPMRRRQRSLPSSSWQNQRRYRSQHPS